MKGKKEFSDHRPRFGWACNLDDDPQIISEKKCLPEDFRVVVIRLPYNSGKVRKKIREFVNGTLWPRE